MTPSKSKDKSELTPVDELSYEQALAELETIVSSLESSKLALEETMSLFERGQQLIRHCAELRVKQLSGGTLTDLDVEE
jgi:exodeoxyribonuclease VII small subunit